MTVEVARRRVTKCRATGGELLAEAETHLEAAAERHIQDLEQRAWLADRMRSLYPEDPALQPWAVMRYVRAEGNAHLLTMEGWEHFTEVIVDLAATLKPHGYTFRDVLHSNLFSGAFYMIRSRHRDEFDPRVHDEQAA